MHQRGSIFQNFLTQEKSSEHACEPAKYPPFEKVGGGKESTWMAEYTSLYEEIFNKKKPDGGVIVVVIRIFELLLEPQVKLPEKKCNLCRNV